MDDAIARGIRPFWIATGILCASVAFCFSQNWYARSLIASLLGRGGIMLVLAFVDAFS
jgi:hypothetical protein